MLGGQTRVGLTRGGKSAVEMASKEAVYEPGFLFVWIMGRQDRRIHEYVVVVFELGWDIRLQDGSR